MQVTVDIYQQCGNDTWAKVRTIAAEASVRMAGQCVADVTLSTAAGRDVLEFSLAHGWCLTRKAQMRLSADSFALLRERAEERGFALPVRVPRNRPLCGHAREKRQNEAIPEQTGFGWEE